MGGCRCSFRNCTSSTKTSENLHFFHYPVKNKERCSLWIHNARKPHFGSLPEDQLRNKVVCEYHFEDRCFINQTKKRLVHNAVPTIDTNEEEVYELMNPDHRKNTYHEQVNINVIPNNDDRTSFTLDTGNTQDNTPSGSVETYILSDDNDVIPVNVIERPVKTVKNQIFVKQIVKSTRNVAFVNPFKADIKMISTPVRKVKPLRSFSQNIPSSSAASTLVEHPQVRICRENVRKVNLQVRHKIVNKAKERARNIRKSIPLHFTKFQILKALKRHISPALWCALSIDLHKKKREFTNSEINFLKNFAGTAPDIYLKLKANGWEFLPSYKVTKGCQKYV